MRQKFSERKKFPAYSREIIVFLGKFQYIFLLPESATEMPPAGGGQSTSVNALKGSPVDQQFSVREPP